MIAGTTLAAPAPAVAALFGDGTHPTSRLAAAALREVLRERPGARVLDVGTGTGVLAHAAALAGADEVVGIDHAPLAVAAARRLVPSARFLVADARDWLRQEAGGAFDVVVANLPDPPLVELVPDLVQAARPGGALVVTGVLLFQVEFLLAAFAAACAEIAVTRAEGGWACFVVRC